MSSTRAGNGNTRERLLDAAERLFAERGIDGVSLNRITAAAGARNASALQYHFGSKTELLQAIFARRMAVVNGRRLELLAGIAPSDRATALRRIAEALVIPFAEQLDGGPGGKAYVRFVAQVYADPRLRMWDLVRGRHDEGVRRIAELTPAILADIPRAVVRQRLALVTTLIIHAVADRERVVAAGDAAARAPQALAAFVAVLIDTIMGALAAPVTQDGAVEEARPHPGPPPPKVGEGGTRA